MGEEQEQKFHQLTEEPVSRVISHLAVPCIISMLVTAFYNMADTFFVGMLRSNAATGAVGVVFSMMAVIQAVGFFFGHGSGNFISRELGRRNTDSASNMAATGFFSALFTGLLICVFGEIFLTPLAAFLGSSPTILPYAKDYLRVILIGAPWMTASLVLNNQLRFQGNAIYGTIGIASGAVLNIGLDYLLIVSMGMGVDGAALATVRSQLLSGGLCAFWFFTRTAKQEELTFRGQSSLLSAGHCKRLAYIGFPMGFEYSVSAIGAGIMQDAINLLGSTAVAAQTAGEKIRQMFTLPMESVGMAMATYVGQNHGAHRTDRIKQGIKDGCTIQLTYCVAAWVVIFFVKPYAVGLVLGDADPAVTAGAIQYLAIMSLLFCFHGLLMIFRNTLQGLGYSVQAIISGVGELIGRSLGGLLAVKTGLGYVGICLSNPFAWGLAMLYCMFMVRRMLKRED